MAHHDCFKYDLTIPVYKQGVHYMPNMWRGQTFKTFKYMLTTKGKLLILKEKGTS